MKTNFKSVTDIKNLLTKKEISSKELLDETYDSIEKSSLNAFISLNKEQAYKCSEAYDQGNLHGDLAGIPIAQKDLFCTKDLRTTCASKILSDFIPPYDATVVQNFNDAGSICIGKTNMDEFAMGSSNETSYFGEVSNPWAKDYVPGGSSGGSAAAVAAGIVPIATGTDTGGSIRQPAALCGISGIKPTYGRASRWGMIAFASSLDQAGVFARTAEDCAIGLNQICKYDPKDTTSVDCKKEDFSEAIKRNIQGIKIGIVREFDLSNLDDSVQNAFQNSIKVFESLGATFKEISLKNIGLSVPTYYVVAPAECSSNLSRFDGVKYGYRCETPKDLSDLYIRSRSEGFGDEVKRRILIGTYVLSAGFYDAYYKKAQQARRLIKDDFDQAFNEVDLILAPSSPGPAFKKGSKSSDPLEMYLEDLFTISANLAGIPAMSIPHGFSNGMPIGLQLIGNFLQESQILRAAHHFQLETDWHKMTPEGNMQ